MFTGVSVPYPAIPHRIPYVLFGDEDLKWRRLTCASRILLRLIQIEKMFATFSIDLRFNYDVSTSIWNTNAWWNKPATLLSNLNADMVRELQNKSFYQSAVYVQDAQTQMNNVFYWICGNHNRNRRQVSNNFSWRRRPSNRNTRRDQQKQVIKAF